jgi:hypothetical protein
LPKTETKHVPHAELATGCYQEKPNKSAKQETFPFKVSQYQVVTRENFSKTRKRKTKPTLKIIHSDTKKYNPK